MTMDFVESYYVEFDHEKSGGPDDFRIARYDPDEEDFNDRTENVLFLLHAVAKWSEANNWAEAYFKIWKGRPGKCRHKNPRRFVGEFWFTGGYCKVCADHWFWFEEQDNRLKDEKFILMRGVEIFVDNRMDDLIEKFEAKQEKAAKEKTENDSKKPS